MHSFPPMALHLARLATATFFAILFIQSGFDKLLNFKENLSWLVGHFKETFLSGLVPAMFILVTFTEVAAGLCSGYGVVEMLIHHRHGIAFMGAAFSALSLLFLFFGQRIAKDYTGAVGLVPYFIVAILTILILA